MEKFNWTNEYSVGIASIDEQHKHFFGIANSVVDLAAKEVSKHDLLVSLGELGNYAFYHFGNEEGYFDKFGYQDAPHHIAEHNQYRERIENYLKRARGEEEIKELAKEMAFYSN